MMKKILLTAAASALLLGSSTTFATSPPPAAAESNDIVADFAHTIPASQERALERDIRAFAVQSHIEIAVVSVRSLRGQPIDRYAHGMFRAWSNGRQDPDGGVLLLAAPHERQVHIEVGPRLASMLTDADIAFIMRNRMQDDMRRNDYGSALAVGARVIMNQLTQGLAAERASHAEPATPQDFDTLSPRLQIVDKVYKTVIALYAIVVLFILVWPARRPTQA